MELLEIVRGLGTSDATVDRALAFPLLGAASAIGVFVVRRKRRDASSRRPRA